MQATVKWVEKAMFVATSGSGHSVVVDGPLEAGGSDQGVRPMEMILMGLGGCTAIDVVLILAKARQQVSDCRIELTAERADTIPAVFTDIHIHFVVSGQTLSEKQVRRAVDLSAEKYCSATIMLKDAVNITHDFEIVEASGAQPT